MKIESMAKNVGVFRTTKSPVFYNKSEVDKKIEMRFLRSSTKQILLRALQLKICVKNTHKISLLLIVKPIR